MERKEELMTRNRRINMKTEIKSFIIHTRRPKYENKELRDCLLARRAGLKINQLVSHSNQSSFKYSDIGL